MPEQTDMELLREYARNNSEAAFAELVQRHLNLVHSVAFRYVGNSHDAQDVAQAVFIILAKKAGTLGDKTVVTGWLYEATRFIATNFLRSNLRRQEREQESFMQSTLNETDTDSAWQQIAPLLEDAMTRLNEKDRTLLALHFFENKTGAEAASLVGLHEWAARKRVERAVEKLRKFFLQRGVGVSAVALVGALSASSVQAAPAGLAASITTTVVTNGAVAGSSTLALVKGSLKLMAWTKAKMAIALAAAVVITAGTTAVVLKESGNHPAQGQSAATNVLLTLDWSTMKKEGRLLSGEVISLDGRSVLKLESTNAAGLQLPLFNILNPPVTAMHYAVTGDIKYEVEGVGHLAMWNFFPPLKPGGQEVQYYSFTGDDEGPMKKIYELSDWRLFSLPLDRTGKTYPESFVPQIDTAVTAKAPTRLGISILLPGRGVVYLSNVTLTQWK